MVSEPLTHGDLFAGIGCFSLAFENAGFKTLWHVEIDKDAQRVLRHHWPDNPLLPDIRDCGKHNLAPVDVITGGFPCQDLSCAGKRAGLAGARSGLFYEMTRIVDELQPRYLVWENVPGLRSSDSGRDFARVLMELGRIGFHGGWTSLDAQFFGVAQRRQRLFGVFARGDIGAERPAEILSLLSRSRRHPEKGRKKRASNARISGARIEGDRIAATLRSRQHSREAKGQDSAATRALVIQRAGGRAGEPIAFHCLQDPISGDVAPAMGIGNKQGCATVGVAYGAIAIQGQACSASGESGDGVAAPGLGVSEPGSPMYAIDATKPHAVAYIVNSAGSCVNKTHARQSEIARCLDQTGGFASGQGGTVIAQGVAQNQRGEVVTSDVHHALGCGGGKPGEGFPCVAIQERGRSGGRNLEMQENLAYALRAPSAGGQSDGRQIVVGMTVRRLTPTECSRLQGVPDDFLVLDPPLSDSTKYRLLGNTIARPCGEWIANRIRLAEEGALP